jgi:hypothetical protein
MLLFRSEEHVARWCRMWKQPRGAVLSLRQGWGLAAGWYSDRLDPNWQSKTVDEAEALFGTLGLTGEFWRMAR